MSTFSPERDNAVRVVCDKFFQFIDNLTEDGELSKIEDYIPNKYEQDIYKWNIEKTKIVLEVLKLRNSDAEKKILSYLECSEYGWQKNHYRLNNACLCRDKHCKRNYKIDNSPEITAEVFRNIDFIFLDKTYGSITSYLFGYCLAALFSSILKRDNLRVPYFLQIACERNSNMHRLIHEIVDICDVNTDLIEECDFDFDYGNCDHDHVTVFPTQQVEKSMEDVICNRDVPVIIDGFENEKFYNDLLRKVANIPGKRRILDSKDKFNVLPIFICPAIRSQFRNVFSMDLTDLDVDGEYLDLVQRNKQMLASWALELVKIPSLYFFPRNTVQDKLHLIPEDERPFFDRINPHIDKIRKRYALYTDLSKNDVNNIGFLTYFLSHYMDVFKRSIKLTVGEKFEYKGITTVHNRTQLIAGIWNAIVESLFDLHRSYSPTLPMVVNINPGSSNKEEAMRTKKKGEKYGKDIIKYYQTYGASIRITDAEFKDNRYIFSVKLLPGTDKKLINRHADEVRMLLELESFTTYIDNSFIKIVASEKPLKENSLIKILESPEFKESKMEIPYAVGYDIMGEMVIADIAKFPHLLIGGTSGSGKSSALHSLIMSVVCRQRPDKVKLLLLDFGASRLKMFNKTPHMLMPVVTVNEIEKGRQCILKLREIMEQRLIEFDSTDERDIDRKLKKWPSIICVIDEFPTFIRKLTAEKNNKMSHMLIKDILERARKIKIHLVLAAQDSTKGNIFIRNTNLDATIAFKCTNWRDSHAIIGEPDAVGLFGAGSMYFRCYQHQGIKRAQGSYMPPEEIMDILDDMKFEYGDIKGQCDALDFELKPLAELNRIRPEPDDLIFEDTPEQKLAEIIMWTLGRDKISNNQIKIEHGMGYDMANAFLRKLEDFGLVTKLRKGTKKSRAIIPKRMEDISDEVVKYLGEYGYTETDIKEALGHRNGIVKYDEKESPATSLNPSKTLNRNSGELNPDSVRSFIKTRRELDPKKVKIIKKSDKN